MSRLRGDHAALLAEVNAAGLLARRPAGYLVRAVSVTVVLAVAWTAFLSLGPSWWQAVVAVALAAASGQVALLGHDAGHHQVFADAPSNDRLGLVAGLLVGMNYRWWTERHARHHANPNLVGHDPDIDGGAISFTTDQARARTTCVGRWLTRHQAATFFPLLLVWGVTAWVAGTVSRLRSAPNRTATLVETLLLAGHVAGYLAVVFLVLPPLPAVGFVVLHQGLFGLYMGCCFGPNHNGMPQLSEADQLDLLHRQVLTSRNIRGGFVLSAVMGGLNYEIEHHLFPDMPSGNLRHAHHIVVRFCRYHGIAYAQASLTSSVGLVLRHLRTVGSTAAAPVR